MATRRPRDVYKRQAQGRVPLTVDELKDAVRACVKPQFVAMNLAAIDRAIQAYG